MKRVCVRLILRLKKKRDKNKLEGKDDCLKESLSEGKEGMKERVGRNRWRKKKKVQDRTETDGRKDRDTPHTQAQSHWHHDNGVSTPSLS